FVFAGMVATAVVTENVFAIPGIGRLVVQSVLRRDYPVIQGVLVMVAAVYMFVNLLTDIAYFLLDPRIRLC
ncbi:MAG: ABC transporter permease subunit, partial [Candidatus Bipolaricaulaceae bacterium]